MATISTILETIQTYSPDANVSTVMDAYLLSARSHAGQKRKSGEAYLSHPLAVAQILADLRMDVETIATALLHDALEDNPITKAEMAAEIGDTVTELVDGVTKIGKLKFRSKEELAAENFRKMMLAMSKDLRVILVKLADRTHNMLTLEHHRPEKQRTIAQETMDIYVPIANRLGITVLKTQLEDQCFRYLHPERYAAIEEFLQRTVEDREEYTEKVVQELKALLAASGIESEVSGRAKHRFSIHRKMEMQGIELNEVADLLAFRVVPADVGACYAALGIVHAHFPPVQDKIKDYIARPKPNGYQSLHTTIIGPEKRRVEVQFRTAEMHRVAEEGIAAHWRYKEGKLALSPEDVLSIARIRNLFETARDAEDATEFMETVKAQLYADEVFIFTPGGDVKRFPLGATALDFAYAVHSKVGHHCVGAKANGAMVPLRYELKSGDTLEILTSPNQQPNRDWLDIARTSRAIAKIRRHLRKLEQEQGAKMGRELLEGELRRLGWTLDRVHKEGRVEAVLKKRGMGEWEQLLVEVARGGLTLSSVARDLLPDGEYEARSEVAGGLSTLLQRLSRRAPSVSPVLISGEGGLLVSFAKCCAPLPGEPVVGFITRGRGITVHKASCSQLETMDDDRRVPVEWDAGHDARHSGTIAIHCSDRPGMLADVTKLCELKKVNISRAEARQSHSEDRANITLEVSVRDVGQLTDLIRSIERIRGVDAVHRVAG